MCNYLRIKDCTLYLRNSSTFTHINHRNQKSYKHVENITTIFHTVIRVKYKLPVQIHV